MIKWDYFPCWRALSFSQNGKKIPNDSKYDPQQDQEKKTTRFPTNIYIASFS